jgi:hypothetical protein
MATITTHFERISLNDRTDVSAFADDNASVSPMPSEPADTLPSELRAFIHTCIESIEQVELLIIMRGSERSWSTRDVSEELGVPLALARRDLDTLAARGLLEVAVGTETTYKYRPKTSDLARYSDLLARHYVSSRHLIFKAVSDTRAGVRRFADAFKLRDKQNE